MKRPGVNLSVLFEEYQAAYPDGYAYSRFCEFFRAFERRLSPTMRQTHVAGDKAFVDDSGKKVPIVDPLTGEVRMAELFIAVLGASNLTYAEASWTQSLPDWIGAHVRMFRFFGSAPRLLIPDNLKSGVNKSSFYDPEINRSYAKMAAHYNVGVVPARPRKPKDKAAVEAGVRFAQSYILGRLRNVTFFSLAECQAAIVVALERMNGREMRRLGVSRRQLFETIERPAMQSLPEQDYEYAEWRFARVGIDYHVRSRVSSTRCRTRCSASRSIPASRRAPSRYSTAASVSRAMRAAMAVRGTAPARPHAQCHRRYAEWSAERFARQARDIGPNTEALILAVLARRPHPEQGFRTCIGVLRLFRGLDAARAEAISHRAVELGALTTPVSPRSSNTGSTSRRRRKPRTGAPAARKHPRLRLFSLRRTSLLNHPTLDRLRELGLDGMAKGFRDLAANPESRALEHAEWLGLLVDQEVTLRQQKRFEARTRTAKLRQAATVEDVDFHKPRGLDRTLFLHP